MERAEYADIGFLLGRHGDRMLLGRHGTFLVDFVYAGVVLDVDCFFRLDALCQAAWIRLGSTKTLAVNLLLYILVVSSCSTIVLSYSFLYFECNVIV